MKRKNNAFALMESDAFTGEYSPVFVSNNRSSVERERSRLIEYGRVNEWRGIRYNIVPTFIGNSK